MSLRLPRPFCAVFLGFAAALALALVLSGAASFFPRGPVIAHVRESVPLMNKFRRSDTFTECLVMGAAALPAKNLADSLFGFEMLRNDIPPDEAIPHDHAPCASLRALVLGTQSVEEIGTQPYWRYWNGPVALARGVLNLMPFLPAYVLYAFCGMGAMALWGYALARKGLDPKKAGLLAFVCFYASGMPYFLGNLAHTPSFALPIGVIALATLKTGWMQDRIWRLGLAAFVGGLTFYLDMLFMAIPFNALLLGTTLLLLDSKSKFGSLVALLAAFAVGGAFVLGAKVGLIALLSGPAAVFQDFSSALGGRFGHINAEGEVFTWAQLLFRLPEPAGKMFGHPVVLELLYLASLAGFARGLRADKARGAAFFLLAAIVPVWCFLFANHSWIHGTFTMRILFWPPLLGFLAAYERKMTCAIAPSARQG